MTFDSRQVLSLGLAAALLLVAPVARAQTLSLEPTAWPTDDFIEVRVHCAQAPEADSVWLTHGDQAITADLFEREEERLTCRFDLRGAPLGLWDLHLHSTAEVELEAPEAFEVLSASRPAEWDPEVRLTNDPGISQNASVAVDRLGRIHVVWEDDHCSAFNIFHRMYNGSSWTEEVPLAEGG